MIVNSVVATENYGSVMKGLEYSVISIKYDWYKIKAGGKIIFCPRWVFE